MPFTELIEPYFVKPGKQVSPYLISREYPPDTGWGGIGAYTYNHARALKEQGHDVEVISLTTKDAKSEPSSPGSSQDPFFVPVHRAVWGPLLEELTTIWISLR